jgi:hypothetical protein
MIKIAAFVLAAFMLALAPTEASAWYCRATSPTGSWGWGRSPSQDRARRIALFHCSIHTPRRYWCRIRYCE